MIFNVIVMYCSCSAIKNTNLLSWTKERSSNFSVSIFFNTAQTSLKIFTSNHPDFELNLILNNEITYQYFLEI